LGVQLDLETRLIEDVVRTFDLVPDGNTGSDGDDLYLTRGLHGSFHGSLCVIAGQPAALIVYRSQRHHSASRHAE
jgi:hypothetical protein